MSSALSFGGEAEQRVGDFTMLVASAASSVSRSHLNNRRYQMEQSYYGITLATYCFCEIALDHSGTLHATPSISTSPGSYNDGN